MLLRHLLVICCAISLHASAQTSTCNLSNTLDAARNAYKGRDYDALLEHCNTAKGCINATTPAAEQASYYLFRGMLLYNERALTAAKAALDSAITLAPDDYAIVGEAESGLGKVTYAQGELETSMLCYQRALVAVRKTSPVDSVLLGVVHHNLANRYNQLGDPERAIQHMEIALTIRRAVSGHSSWAAARTQIMLAVSYENVNVAKSLQNYHESIAVLEELGERGASILPVVWINMSDLLALEGDRTAQINALRHGMSYYNSTNEDDFSALGTAYRSLGETYLAMGNQAQAAPLLDSALHFHLAAHGTQHRQTGTTLVARSQLAAAQHNGTAAIGFAHRALQAFCPSFVDTATANNPTREQLTMEPWIMVAFAAKARGYTTRFEYEEETQLDLEQALACYEAAFDQASRIRSSFNSGEARDYLAEVAHPAYTEAIGTMLQLHQIFDNRAYAAKAFELAEQSRAVLVLESLMELEALGHTELPDSIYEQGETLEATIDALRFEVWQAAQQQAPTDSLRNELLTLQEKQDAFLAQVRSAHPQFYKRLETPEIASAQTVQAWLPDTNSMLLEYVLSPTHISVIAISKTGIGTQRIERTTDFDEALQRFLAALSTPPTSSADVEQFAIDGAFLYNVLVETPLGTIPFIHNLYIIPHGKLWQLPFEALVTERVASTGPKATFASLPYAVRKHQFHYSWSATVLTHSFAGTRNRAPEQLLAMAPNFSGTQGANTLGQSLQALPGAQRSSAAITELMKGNLLAGSAATEQAFKANASRYQILHLATHGLLDNEEPMNSAIALEADADSTEDGLLRGYEICNLNLQADLVVLSACNTGSGVLKAGEGVASMARGFALAGCPSLVMSLWEAQDASTAWLLEHFYAKLAAGESNATALHASKLAYLENASVLEAHPYYWAVFVGIGQPVALPAQTAGFSWWWLAGILALALAVWGIRKKAA